MKFYSGEFLLELGNVLFIKDLKVFDTLFGMNMHLTFHFNLKRPDENQ